MRETYQGLGRGRKLLIGFVAIVGVPIFIILGFWFVLLPLMIS